MKYFKIIMSNKDFVVIDENDFKKLESGMNAGSFVQLKKGIVNPSFIVAVLPMAQKDALESETSGRKTEGYIDEKSGNYVITKDEKPVSVELKDEFV